MDQPESDFLFYQHADTLYMKSSLVSFVYYVKMTR